MSKPIIPNCEIQAYSFYYPNQTGLTVEVLVRILEANGKGWQNKENLAGNE
jgi:hypothetical protein